jgi:hypothetical protein
MEICSVFKLLHMDIWIHKGKLTCSFLQFLMYMHKKWHVKQICARICSIIHAHFSSSPDILVLYVHVLSVYYVHSTYCFMNSYSIQLFTSHKLFAFLRRGLLFVMSTIASNYASDHILYNPAHSLACSHAHYWRVVVRSLCINSSQWVDPIAVLCAFVWYTTKHIS